MRAEGLLGPDTEKDQAKLLLPNARCLGQVVGARGPQGAGKPAIEFIWSPTPGKSFVPDTLASAARARARALEQKNPDSGAGGGGGD